MMLHMSGLGITDAAYEWTGFCPSTMDPAAWLPLDQPRPLSTAVQSCGFDKIGVGAAASSSGAQYYTQDFGCSATNSCHSCSK